VLCTCCGGVINLSFPFYKPVCKKFMSKNINILNI
jgi:hypothetical protein